MRRLIGLAEPCPRCGCVQYMLVDIVGLLPLNVFYSGVLWSMTKPPASAQCCVCHYTWLHWQVKLIKVHGGRDAYELTLSHKPLL